MDLGELFFLILFYDNGLWIEYLLIKSLIKTTKVLPMQEKEID